MDFICVLNYIWNFISIFICGVQLYVSISIPLHTKKFRFSIINVYIIIHKKRRFFHIHSKGRINILCVSFFYFILCTLSIPTPKILCASILSGI